MQPIVIHLDMNSYFATVEQQDNLAWRGKPLGVCEHLGSIIIAASIEAKRWGIKTGTPVWEARKLFPKIILTKTHPDRYRMYIKRVIKVVSDYTNFVEQASIDELYADVTRVCNLAIPVIARSASDEAILSWGKDRFGCTRDDKNHNPFAEAASIAQEIKRRMKKEVGDYLTCSIGIADNKLVAKIASDMQKPNGLVVVTSDKFQVTSNAREQLSAVLFLSKADLYQRLKLTDIPGIGRRQEKNLNRLGIKTLLDLKNYPKSLLVAKFGINGYHLHKMGQLEGRWKPKVELETEIKSIGHMYTLPLEYRQPKFFVPVLYKLCEMVAKRLRKQGLMGNIIHFYVYPATKAHALGPSKLDSDWSKRTKKSENQFGAFGAGVHDKDYNGFGKSLKIGFYVYDGREIFLQAMAIFQSIKPPSMGFKLIGITVAGLRPYTQQLSLFGHEERLKGLVGALDKINAKYGDFTVCRAPILAAKDVFADSVGFGRVKER